MKNEIADMIERIEALLEDSPHKIKIELAFVISLLKKAKTQDDLITIQEHLEFIVNMSNIDPFISTEIYDAISIIESLI